MTTSYSLGQIWWAIKRWVQMKLPNAAKGWPVQYDNLALFTNNIYDRCWNINRGLILPLLFFHFEVSYCRPALKAWPCKHTPLSSHGSIPPSHLFPGTSSQALARPMPLNRAAMPLLHFSQHAALLYGIKCQNAKQDFPRPQHLERVAIGTYLSSVYQQKDKTIPHPLWKACLVGPLELLAFKLLLLVSPHAKSRSAGELTILLSLSSHHERHSASLIQCSSHTSSATWSLPQLHPTNTSLATTLILCNQGLLADFSPTRKRLKEENLYRLSFQAGRTSEFSAVRGFMINRHATVSTKVSVTPCWSAEVDFCLKRTATEFREIQVMQIM